MKIINNLFILIMIFLITSCGEKSKKKVTDFDQINFFDVVYETTYYRSIGNTTWIEIVGTREIKFDVTTSVNEDQELPNDLVGEFTFNFVNYRVSSLNPLCSGGYQGGGDYNESGISGALAIECLRIPSNERRDHSKCKNGNVVIQESTLQDSASINGYFNLNLFDSGINSREITEDPEKPWNVNDEYNNGSGDLTDEENQIKKYEFSLNIGKKNFTPTDCENPFNPHDIVIYRFPNGTLIYQDSSKGLEYYMRPKLRIERN